MKLRSFFILAVILAGLYAGSSPASARFQLSQNFEYQDISFSSNAHGLNTLLSYVEPGWGAVRGGVRTLSRFGDSVLGYQLGVDKWISPDTLISADVEMAPNAIVLPRQAYSLEWLRRLSRDAELSARYRYAQYAAAQIHLISPAWTARIAPDRELLIRYYLNLTNAGAQNFTDHSVMTKFTWIASDTDRRFAGYALSNESFESGNPVNPLAGFTGHHLFAGLRRSLTPALSGEFALDYEFRNTGARLLTVTTGLTHYW